MLANSMEVVGIAYGLSNITVSLDHVHHVVMCVKNAVIENEGLARKRSGESGYSFVFLIV